MSRGSTSPLADIATLWFQAPLVIATRANMMWTSPLHSARMQAETTRMVSEKVAASTEAMIAWQFAMMRELMRPRTSVSSKAIEKAGGRIAASSVRPYAKRVRGNAKRLG
ncbi:hypothetical protein [Pararhizobium mangrovi]|uniref:Uncharacterized protein n=1 Tax=Pararhizobium mangrovi TaxID=2590452 RepID=A0A506UBZ8_9HYPH|nr:hypothetical protein [Pararhizobium mangrovi]TPW31943.1 hypothetical protein FJU11_01770 [Pararhizobium mangrovi]